MAGPRWKFYDPTTTEEYEFEVNPNEGGSPEYSKTITVQSTAAPDGKAIVMEGRDTPLQMNFSGVLLDQEQHETFIDWYLRRKQIRLTDDLGRQFYIYITKYTPTRQRAIHSRWKHSYQIEAIVLTSVYGGTEGTVYPSDYLYPSDELLPG